MHTIQVQTHRGRRGHCRMAGDEEDSVVKGVGCGPAVGRSRVRHSVNRQHTGQLSYFLTSLTRPWLIQLLVIFRVLWPVEVAQAKGSEKGGGGSRKLLTRPRSTPDWHNKGPGTTW